MYFSRFIVIRLIRLANVKTARQFDYKYKNNMSVEQKINGWRRTQKCNEKRVRVLLDGLILNHSYHLTAKHLHIYSIACVILFIICN